jgi:hypothetical protein
MSLDTMHSELIKHYRKNSITKQQKNIKKESVIKQSLIKKGNDNEKISNPEDFLRN